MTLYENIKARRLFLNLSQRELADKLGYKSTSTIAKIEAGKNDIPQSKIKAFAEALETTPGSLMGYTSPIKEYPNTYSIINKAENNENEALLSIQAANKLQVIYDMLSEKGQRKFIEYLFDLKNNGENIDPEKYIENIFTDNLNEEALKLKNKLLKKVKTKNHPRNA